MNVCPVVLKSPYTTQLDLRDTTEYPHTTVCMNVCLLDRLQVLYTTQLDPPNLPTPPENKFFSTDSDLES